MPGDEAIVAPVNAHVKELMVEQLSVTIGLDVTIVPIHPAPFVGALITGEGQNVKSGLVSSTTVTVNEQVCVLPCTSVAV